MIAAQAVPEDCCELPPFASLSASASDAVSVPCRATVMSAPMRVSRNGETDCLTDTAEAPFGLALFDQVASALAPFGAARPFGAGPVRVEASTLSWLQSSLLMSMSFRMSVSLTSGATAASSAAGISASSSAGGVCAAAASTENRLKPATSVSSLVRRNRVVEFIARLHSKSRQECVRSGAKLWRGAWSQAIHVCLGAGKDETWMSGVAGRSPPHAIRRQRRPGQGEDEPTPPCGAGGSGSRRSARRDRTCRPGRGNWSACRP